jgi:hypothetical protein
MSHKPFWATSFAVVNKFAGIDHHRGHRKQRQTKALSREGRRCEAHGSVLLNPET